MNLLDDLEDILAALPGVDPQKDAEELLLRLETRGYFIGTETDPLYQATISLRTALRGGGLTPNHPAVQALANEIEKAAGAME